ncbi:hypothetical protein WN55_01736 [Dufourea novaeangliae]|uniref:Uncharacterized protein n=1 Tax=Dufourea novaeangliae TaxID=178035 RepID=A0A154PGM8_DUFNO|nr:hypothetical protein WN55_01736 [Dufourea novaeangliae]
MTSDLFNNRPTGNTAVGVQVGTLAWTEPTTKIISGGKIRIVGGLKVANAKRNSTDAENYFRALRVPRAKRPVVTTFLNLRPVDELVSTSSKPPTNAPNAQEMPDVSLDLRDWLTSRVGEREDGKENRLTTKVLQIDRVQIVQSLDSHLTTEHIRSRLMNAESGDTERKVTSVADV